MQGPCTRAGAVTIRSDTAEGERAGSAAAGRDGFVGRARELGELRAALHAAERGESRLVLVLGEPGIGKTRLAEQIVREAGDRGARILRGRCWEGDGAPAYWPWTMALRELAVDVDPATVRGWLGAGSAALAHLAPELVPDVAPLPADGDAESVRFRVFDAVATLLRRWSEAHPVVVVLDDLHWADAASLSLLQFVARQLPQARVLLLGTLRRVEARQRIDAGVRERLLRAGRLVELSGLAPTDVADLVRVHRGADAPADLAARVHAASDGNPLFVDALLRMMDAGDAVAAVPEDLRELLRARLQPLSPTAREILTVAALLGREFAVSSLARAAGVDVTAVLSALDEAIALDLVAATADGDRRRFAHALYAESLADDLPANRRAALHGRIARALEPLADTGAVPIDEIAAHYLGAVPAGAIDAAVAWALRAAEYAGTRLAHEDEVRYYRRALAVLDAGALTEPSRRIDLLLRLAEAERRAGDAEAARGTFHRAGTLAMEHGQAESLARAALGYGAGFGGLQDQGGGAVDPERVRLVEAALAAIGPEPSGARAQLLAHLAAALFWSGTPERRDRVRQLDRDAVAMAAAHADARVALGVVAQAHWTSWGPDDAEGRLQTAESIVRQATEQGQPELVLRGRMYAAAHHLELGDVAAADREVERFAELAAELRMLRQTWYPNVYRAMRAHLAGRFDEMEQLAEDGMSVGEVAHPFAARLAFRAQLALLRREQGRTAETIDALRQMAAAAPGMPVWRCALASGLAAVGDLAGARVELDRLVGTDGASLPRDFLWLFGMTHLARACAAVADTERAGVVYDLLAPHAGRVAVAQHGVLCDGAIDRALGLLAFARGESAVARRHWERALALDRRLGATIFVTATQVDLAVLLRAEAGADAVQRARDLLAAAASEADRIGQVALVARIAALRDGETNPPPAVVVDVCTLRRTGDDWTVAHGGRTAIVRHVIGLEYLATLLRHPATEIHALDLVTSADPGGAGVAGDAGALLDDRARATYRRRLGELAAELEEARDFNDPGRAERAQAEIDALTGELARAVGLGGRARLAGAATERARLNVTRALRRAIEAIGAHHAVLAGDLGRGVRTGNFCSYTPDPRLPIHWEL